MALLGLVYMDRDQWVVNKKEAKDAGLPMGVLLTNFRGMQDQSLRSGSRDAFC